MKRIVNGHFADPTSTRTISDILPEEFDVIRDSIEHIKKKYGFLLELSDDAWRKMMSDSKVELKSISLDEFEMSDEMMIEGREVIKRDLDITTALEVRVILLTLSKSTNEISDLSNEEFRVFIDALRHTCLDFSNLVNSSKEEMLEQVEKINKGSNLIEEGRLNEGLDRITTEEHREETYAKVQMLFSILEIINQPYEGAEYIGKDGNKLDTTKVNESNPTSIN
jgi:hypothetical protein